jgi:hypothetical protein
MPFVHENPHTFALILRIIHAFNTRKKHEDNDFPLYIYTIISNAHLPLLTATYREWYARLRSTHWAYHLFNSPREYFIDADFQRTFRMSRDSFEILHALLEPFIKKQSTSKF